MSIWKVEIQSEIILKVNCSSWIQSTRTQMYRQLNHFIGGVLSKWQIGDSYLTFRNHRGNTDSSDEAPDTTLPVSLIKKIPDKYTPQINHTYSTRP